MKKKYSALLSVILLSLFGFMGSCITVCCGGEILLSFVVVLAIFIELWLIERRVIGYPRFHRKTLSWLGCCWHAICAILFVFCAEPICKGMLDSAYECVSSNFWEGVLVAILLLRFVAIQPLYIKHCDRRKML